MMKLPKTTMSMVLLWAASSLAHPYYVSICQIDHNPETAALEITFKLFTDDLERAVEASTGTKLHLGEKKQHKQAGALIFGYLTQHFTLKTDGKPRHVALVGFEVEDDLTYCYLEIVEISKLETVSVTNSTLIEVFPEQSNVVHVAYAGQLKSMLMYKTKVSGTVTFTKNR